MQFRVTPRRALLVAMVIALFASRSPAQIAYSVNQSRGDGFSFEGENGWPIGQGYRPFRVMLRSGKVTGDDREFTIEIENSDYYRRKMSTTVGKLTIPAGARAGEEVITLPQAENWQQQSIRIYEDGRQLRKLDSYASSNVYGYGPSLNLPSFLCITDKFIDTSLLTDAMELASRSQQGNVYYGNLNQNIINGKAQYPTEFFTQVPLNKLPRGWLNYTSPDVICMHVDDLVKLADGQPEILQAICRGTTAGGNLWIWGAGESWQRLPEIEARTGLWGPTAPAWRDPNINDFSKGLDGEFSITRSVDYAMPGGPVTASESTSGAPSPNQRLNPPKSPPFRTRAAQLGMVLVFAGDRPVGANPASPEEIANWVWATNTAGPERLLARQRQGIAIADDNPDFWKQMIPGVGKAPVTAFRVLISAFVLAIGPLNYYWLRRKGKLHLLLAVVPITALVVTAGLFGYALLTDGLQVRVRPRTFTTIDQNRQHAASVARVTYYAGLAPASGLLFDGDTIVQPVDPNATAGMGWRRRLITWEGNQQRMTNGWLASRTPTQLQLTRSRPTTHGLRITPAKDGAPPQVVNALGANIEHLLLRDEHGEIYRCGATARGAACKLEKVTARELPELRRYFDERALVQNPDIQLNENSYSAFGTVYYYGQTNEPAVQSDGLLEKALVDAKEAMSGAAALAPRSYLAIVDQSPEVDYGLGEVRQELPLHVVHGEW